MKAYPDPKPYADADVEQTRLDQNKALRAKIEVFAQEARTVQTKSSIYQKFA